MPAWLRAVFSPLRRASSMYAVLERDFLVFTSQKRFLAARTLCVLVPAVVIGILAANGVLEDRPPDEVGRWILGGAIGTVAPLLVLLAPALSASSIASERSLRTLEIVLVAPVGAWTFVLAKFLSRLGMMLVLLYATVPLASVALVYGGISWGLFLDTVALSVGIAVLGVAAGTLVSAHCTSVARAVLVTYALTLLLPLLYLTGLTSYLVGMGAAGRALHATYAIPVSFFAIGQLLQDVVRGGAVSGVGLAHLTTSSVLAVPALLLAGARLSRESRRGGARRRGRRRVRAAEFGHAVVDRELRGSIVSRPGWTAGAVLAAVVLSEGLFLAMGAVQDELHRWWPHLIGMCVATVVILFQILAAAAGSVASERQQGSLRLLLTTPLGAGHIVGGKAAAILLAALPLLAIPAVHGFVAVPRSELNTASVLGWAGVAAVLALLFTSVGLRISIAARTTGRAVLAAFGVLLGGMVVHGVAGVLFVIVTGGRQNELMEFYGSASPPVLLFALPILLAMNAGHGNWNHTEQVTVASRLFWLVAYGVLATLLLARAEAALARHRES